MSDINRELLDLAIPVIEQETSKVVGTSVIFTFPVENSDSIRPFIVFPLSLINKDKHYYLCFKLIPENNYNVFIDYDSCTNQILGDTGFVAFPLAGLLNDLAKQNKKLNFKTISKNNLFNCSDNNKPTSIEQLTIVKSIILDGQLENVILKRNNVIPFYEDNKIIDKFYIESTGLNNIGSPVLLFNEGSYYSQNSVYIGNRLYFLGLTAKNMNDFDEVISLEKIASLIAIKFSIN